MSQLLTTLPLFEKLWKLSFTLIVTTFPADDDGQQLVVGVNPPQTEGFRGPSIFLTKYGKLRVKYAGTGKNLRSIKSNEWLKIDVEQFKQESKVLVSQ